MCTEFNEQQNQKNFKLFLNRNNYSEDVIKSYMSRISKFTSEKGNLEDEDTLREAIHSYIAESPLFSK